MQAIPAKDKPAFSRRQRDWLENPKVPVLNRRETNYTPPLMVKFPGYVSSAVCTSYKIMR